MAQYTQDTFRGLIIPSDKVNDQTLDSASSSFTQAGPEVGIPEPQSNTDINLQASGTQPAGHSLRIATQVGGFGGEGRATFRYQEQGDTTWRGCNTPGAMSGWRSIVWTDGSGAGLTKTEAAHTITLSNETVLVAYHATITSKDVIQVTAIDTSGAATTVPAFSSLSVSAAGIHPCLVELPSGRVLLFHYVHDAVVGTLQIAVRFSDDRGATWTLQTLRALSVSIVTAGAAYDTFPASGMRVSYSNGQLLMLIANRGAIDSVKQYASSDGGSTFDLVSDWLASTVNAIAPNILPVTGGGFEVFTISGNADIQKRSLGSAFDNAVNSPLNTITIPQAIANKPGATFTEGELSVVRADTGEAWLVFRYNLTGTFDRVGLWYSRMGFAGSNVGGGVGQTTGLANLGQVWNGEGGNDYPTGMTATVQAGRMVIFHNWIATTGNEDNSLGAMFLGGYSDVTLPAYQEDGASTSSMNYEVTWLPIERPQDMPNWTHAAGGANTSTLQAGGLNLTTAPGNNSYHRVPAGTVAEGISAHFAAAFIASGLGSEKIRAQFDLEDGVKSYKLKVYLTGTVVAVRDVVSGGLLGSATIQTTDPGVEVMVFMKEDKATVYVRSRTYEADRKWTNIISNVTLANGGAGVASEIRWGHDAASSAQSNWYWFNYCSDNWACGVPSATGFSNPTALRGRPYGSTAVYVTDGVEITAVDGPSVPGDTWHIDTRYQYSIENILPLSNPSPAKEWRSTGETAQTIIWDMGGVLPAVELGLHLEGINWRTGSLSGFNISTGLWEVIATIDAATRQTGLRFKLVGDTYAVDYAAGAFNNRYLDRGELDGATFAWSPADTRKIIKQTQGVLSNSANSQSPLIKLAITGGEPANPTVDLWSPQVTVVAHYQQVVYTKLKLVIDANQKTHLGYYTIGQMVLGPLHLFTQDYSWGRIQESQPNTELVTYRDGSRSSFQRGDSRRSVQFGWLEGVDTSSLQGTAPSPDWVKSTSTALASSVGYRGDIPSLLVALNEETAGAHVPLVYLPSIPAGTPDTLHLQGKSKALYGRMIGGITQDTLVGEEASSAAGEVIKVSNIKIEGEL
tara:strand:+ start:20870 stop:24103 length:3234 start_codon:yes stop_codon:yes gene_type:complete